MKKNLILTVFSIIVGILLSIFMFNQYGDKNELMIASTNTTKYYFVQLGAYSSYDSMMNNTNKLYEFIYTNDNELYYVFGCITKDKDNVGKIEGFFKDNGYITYIKEFNLSNRTLDTEVNNIDLLLSNTDDKNSIKELCKQTLILYKEG